MLTTKDLSGLPDVKRLKTFCKGLAALDIIMLEEKLSYIRKYSYHPTWHNELEAFIFNDGADQHMIVMFASEGCVINGVDFELYDWDEELPPIEDLTKDMPDSLKKLMQYQEVKDMKSTFCIWNENGTTWHCNPMDSEDASQDMLPILDGDPQSYVDFAKWFYETELPLKVVGYITDGVPMTKDMITALNPERSDWESIKSELNKIGYPNAL